MRDLGLGNRGITAYNLRWPDTQEFTQVISKLANNAVDHMLGIVWQGYENLKENFLSHIDFSLADEEIERSVTQTLAPEIRNCLSGDEIYDVQHCRYEFETRAPAPAQPPEYDIAFFLKPNGRIMWPLEAKVMRSPANVAPYFKDIENEFLTGRYAPFSRSAAMLGYLLSGNASDAAQHVARKLSTQLLPHPSFHPQYDHYVSDYFRNLSNASWASGEFQCHHMIMPLIT